MGVVLGGGSRECYILFLIFVVGEKKLNFGVFFIVGRFRLDLFKYWGGFII